MVIYPAIDLRRGRCVRLRQGRPEDETVFGHDPVAMARHWVHEGATWLHIVNLDGAFGQASSNVSVLREIIAAVDVSVQFGGGLRDRASIEKALSLGVQRIILGTAAVREPELVAAAVERFGAERVAVGIDTREGLVAVRGWRDLSSMTALELALRMKDLGVIHIVHTDIACDGMLSGVNVEASAELAQLTGLQIIASGGVSSLDDIRRLKMVEPQGVEGVIIGQALYMGAITLSEAIRLAESS